jgi:hypothetical protein
MLLELHMRRYREVQIFKALRLISQFLITYKRVEHWGRNKALRAFRQWVREQISF